MPAYTFMSVVPRWELGLPNWMEDVRDDDPPVWETQYAYLNGTDC